MLSLEVSMEKFGLLDSQPFQFGFDLPCSGLQLHLHGPDLTTITHGQIVDRFNHKNVLHNLNGFDAAMAVHHAQMMGWDPFRD